VEDEYLRTWEDRWLVESRELLDEEEKSLRKRLETVDEEYTIENNYMNEAKQFFLNYTAKISVMVETWEKIYAKDVGAIDLHILSLEEVQDGLNESYEKLWNNVDELRLKVDEQERLKNIRVNRISKTDVNSEQSVGEQEMFEEYEEFKNENNDT